MRKIHKFLSIILAVFIVISIIPITASAATYTGTCGDNLTWTYNTSSYTLTISGIGAIYDYEYNNRPWESYEDKIKNVVVEDGVTSIGNYSFYGCGYLVNVTLPDGVTKIGHRAFYSCNSLANITIPDTVTTIGQSAFYYCYSLKSINIPYGITTISAGAFNLCEKLIEITIPDSVTEIGEYAFAGCDGLTEIIIPDSVTTIGKHAFSGCYGLISVTIGNGVTTIGNSAFNSCKGLTTITIPKNVATIESRAFANCEKLTGIMVDNDNQYFVNDEYGVLFNQDKTTLMQYPIGHTRTSYTIPDGVTTIEEMAFYNCLALTNVTFPNGVETINYCAFDGCANITSIILPDGVTTIDSWAFGSCSSLESITIPASVTRISSNAISYKTTIIYYGGTANQWKQLLANNPASEGGYLEENIVFCADQMLLPSGACGDNLTWSYNMLTGVLRISGAGDMYNYGTHHLSLTNTPWSTFLNDIKEVVIEDGVTSIGTYAFYGCSNLSDVKIGDGVTTIGERAFEYCRGLNTVTIGNGVTTIEKYAFKECTGLTSVIIPVSVTDMDSGAFYKCSGITDVYYEGTEEQWIDNIILFSPDNALIGVKIPFNKDVTIHFNYHIHKYNSVVSEPTCTEQGYTTYTCECGESYIDNYVDATGHSYDSVVTPPTCTEKGYTTYTCECGDSYVDNYVDATGHTYGEWTVTKDATVDTEGEMERVCPCGEKEYNAIEKLSAVDDKEEVEDTNKEDAKNPEIPNTDYSIKSSAHILFVVFMFVCVVLCKIPFRKKIYNFTSGVVK
ncbi:MAG: leucine-rich repeat domain-containing protein [Clostridia bacterium]|nr:leucine-rich repeat domain-containing protein [Clostridia bacterium]